MMSRITGRLLFVLLLCLLGKSTFAVETEVLFDGRNVADWDTARDHSRLEQEFSRRELTRAANPDALRWRFVSRGVAFNDIFLMKPVRRPFSAFRVLVKNEGEAVTFAAKIADADLKIARVEVVRPDPPVCLLSSVMVRPTRRVSLSPSTTPAWWRAHRLSFSADRRTFSEFPFHCQHL